MGRGVAIRPLQVRPRRNPATRCPNRRRLIAWKSQIPNPPPMPPYSQHCGRPIGDRLGKAFSRRASPTEIVCCRTHQCVSLIAKLRWRPTFALERRQAMLSSASTATRRRFYAANIFFLALRFWSNDAAPAGLAPQASAIRRSRRPRQPSRDFSLRPARLTACSYSGHSQPVRCPCGATRRQCRRVPSGGTPRASGRLAAETRRDGRGEDGQRELSPGHRRRLQITDLQQRDPVGSVL
ncbi:hypothetical protein BRSPCE3_34590 [Bradyrhizobium sp. Ce-3]|nr:hypothetical protein BRSPCE3_34590 [Bradyrhizobium sp. Ce-3]